MCTESMGTIADSPGCNYGLRRTPYNANKLEAEKFIFENVSLWF